MNMEIEKKWFVYVGDHHEGPLSIPEVAERQDQGALTPETYVWCEGMADWLMLSQVNELESGLREFRDASRPAPSAPLISGRIEQSVKASAPKSKNSTKSRNLPLIIASTLLLILVGSVITLAALSRTSNEELHASIRPLLSRIVNLAPPLSSLFRIIPSLNDVKEDELFELEAARIGNAVNGARLALAVSNLDPNRPFFYVSTNLPHGTRFEIHLVGQPETLLNRLQFSTQGPVLTQQGFGKSEVFLAEGGQPVPKGRYQVYLVESSEQDAAIKGALGPLEGTKFNGKLPASLPATSKFVLVKSVFLGGERDETYLARLKAFHEKVRAGSEKELLELKQYAETLDSQFSALTVDFQTLYRAKKATAAMRNAWKKDASLWVQFSTQLDQTLQTWSKETLENEFFYGKIYALVKTSYQSMKLLFELESGFIDKPGDRSAFEIQHGKLLSDTRQSLEILKQKLDTAVKAPKAPGGLPNREGL
jgi:hypothetical protein